MKNTTTIIITVFITAAVVVLLARCTNQYYQGSIQSESSGYQPFYLSKELVKKLEQYGIDKIDFISTKDENGAEKQIAQFVVGSLEEARDSEKLTRTPNEEEFSDNKLKSHENSESNLIDTHIAPHLALLFATTTPTCPPLASWEPSSCRMMTIKYSTNPGGIQENSTHCHCYMH